MTTTKANAAVVTKLLKTAGFEQAAWHNRNRPEVKNDGFLSEQVDDTVYAQWVFRIAYRPINAAEQEAERDNLAAMANVLAQAGYTATVQGDSNPCLVIAKAA